jgi:hypothetical protein
MKSSIETRHVSKGIRATIGNLNHEFLYEKSEQMNVSTTNKFSGGPSKPIAFQRCEASADLNRGSSKIN